METFEIGTVRRNARFERPNYKGLRLNLLRVIVRSVAKLFFLRLQWKLARHFSASTKYV